MSFAPRVAARSTSFSAAITRSTALAAAQARGFPPKVVPWSPICTVLATAALHRKAATGKPPPRPLARVTMSGTTGSCWYPSGVPVRPIPVWTSSQTSSAPLASQISRSPAR